MVLPFLKKNHKKRDLNQANKSTRRQGMSKGGSDRISGSEAALDLKDCDVIGHASVKGLASCPCCNRNLNVSRQTVGETRLQTIYGSLFRDDGSETESCHSFDDMDEEGSMMPGVLSGGTPYVVTKNVVQGWVHKKGTGMDWIGSRAWKPRWAVLSVSEIVLRLLMIICYYWHLHTGGSRSLLELLVMR